MDQQAFLNEYVTQLGNQYKNVLMEKVLLTTQLTLAQRQVEELQKQLEELQKKADKKKPKEEVSEFTN